MTASPMTASLIITMALLALTGCDGRRLISDQAMIDHFQAHKQEFNELTQLYLHRSTDIMAWSARPDVIELKKKTGIDRIIDAAGYWFENPYSTEAAIKSKEMRDNNTFSQNNFRSAALIKMADTNIFWAAYFWNGGLNWKDYIYFPIDPEIENERIKLPKRIPARSTSDLWLRVLNSLDSPKWERGECVLRKIEPQWFLSRCRAN